MFQSKQRRTYLANQSCSGAWKSKLLDVASLVAAPDASPLAAILLAVATISPPRAEKPCRVASDAVLEGQQCVPLVRDRRQLTLAVLPPAGSWGCCCWEGVVRKKLQVMTSSTKIEAGRCMMAMAMATATDGSPKLNCPWICSFHQKAWYDSKNGTISSNNVSFTQLSAMDWVCPLNVLTSSVAYFKSSSP